MFDGLINVLDLGGFTDKEKSLLKSDYTYKIQMNQLMKEACQAAKKILAIFARKRYEFL